VLIAFNILSTNSTGQKEMAEVHIRSRAVMNVLGPLGENKFGVAPNYWCVRCFPDQVFFVSEATARGIIEAIRDEDGDGWQDSAGNLLGL
jgi:hypothetical protein